MHRSATTLTPAVQAPFTSSSAPRKILPKLTEAEKKCLNEHKGCYKYRHINVDHRAADCPYNYPEANNYVSPLTLVQSCKANSSSFVAPSKPCIPNSGRVGFVNKLKEENAPANDPLCVAAIMYVASFCVLSSPDENNSSEDNECIVPSTSRNHIWWHAIIHSPLTISHEVKMLIDCGSTGLLVSGAFAAAIRLESRPLQKLLPLGAA